MRFGRLTVIAEGAKGTGRQRWRVRCDCGALAEVVRSHLLTGSTSSCGCLARERMHALNLKHGRSETAEFDIWQGMIRRCEDTKSDAWANYGARGISVCARWRESFAAFLADVGPRPSPGHSIDRIDNNGNYEPANCRWATWREQQRNRRSNVELEFRGERACLVVWSERTGIALGTLCRRLRRGWSVERTLTEPAKPTRRYS